MFLTSVTIAALFLTIVFGIQYRMVKHPLARKAGQALMNIFMGATLILFSINQILHSDVSVTRIIVGGLLGALGLFNLIMGIKNYRFYKSQLS
ncbi:MAG TPA: YtpI family protein [Bacillota bacterium]|nr:YtpI family protein [Bacillota bacterium]